MNACKKVRFAATNVHRLCGVGIVALALLTTGSAYAQGAVNNDPAFLKVYVNNVENLPPSDDPLCPSDWTDLVYYMKSRPLLPDLFIVQQISNRDQADALAAYMTTQLGAPYAAIVATNDPAEFNSPCGPNKQFQTNGIVYRNDRLIFKKKSNWQSYRLLDGNCVLNTQDRTINMRAQFTDVTANKTVTIATLHWPTVNRGGPPCAVNNIDNANAKITAGSYAAHLYIVGGDTAARDLVTQDVNSNWETWYARANGELGGVHNFRDVIYDLCRETTDGTPIAIKQCLLGNFTYDDEAGGGSGPRRIDYLFAKRAGSLPNTDAAHTIEGSEAGSAALFYTGSDDPALHYSLHKAVRARAYY